MIHRTALFGVPLMLFVLGSFAPAQIDDATKQLSHDIFKQLIDINTTDSVGSVTAAAEAMAKRLRDAGFPESDMQVMDRTTARKILWPACMDGQA